MNEKVESVLTEIRPFLQRDGGDISLLSILDGVVTVIFTGFCSTCNKSNMTLTSIEAIVMEKIPEIKKVVEA
ncbi:MAG TPA: NifU family protein [Lutibacter sp.]|nr:NifU family protein [Lutibacter sp.]